MNRPTNTDGSAAGMATLSTRKRLDPPERACNIVIGVRDGGDAGPGEDRDGKSGRKRDQEDAGAPARRKGEKRQRQPCNRRQRADEAQHGMDPIARQLRPADGDADKETRGSAQQVSDRQ